MRKKQNSEKERNCTDLIASIKNELETDPYFISELKNLIDNNIAGEISDNDLFEFLKPAFTQKSPTLEDIFSGRKTSTEVDTSLVVSPESVDMLFYPQVRKKLKEWQQTFFDDKSTESQKIKAEGNLKKVFERLTYIGQGKRKKNEITTEQKRGIREWFKFYDQKSKEVFKRSKRNSNERNLRIKEKFGDIGTNVLKQGLSTSSPERLRDALLAIKNNCSIRAVKECIVEFTLIKVHKYLSDKRIEGLTIRGSGSKTIITKHAKS